MLCPWLRHSAGLMTVAGTASSRRAHDRPVPRSRLDGIPAGLANPRYSWPAEAVSACGVSARVPDFAGQPSRVRRLHGATAGGAAHLPGQATRGRARSEAPSVVISFTASAHEHYACACRATCIQFLLPLAGAPAVVVSDAVGKSTTVSVVV